MTKKIVVSSEKGKQCDLFPWSSVHDGEFDEHGFRIAGKSNWIPPTFTLVDYSGDTKQCPYCKLDFAADAPFVVASQKGDEDMCIRCHERRYVVGRDEYKDAVRAELIAESKILNKHYIQAYNMALDLAAEKVNINVFEKIGFGDKAKLEFLYSTNKTEGENDMGEMFIYEPNKESILNLKITE